MHQDHLLTLRISPENSIENVLPGVDLQVLFLDGANGIWVVYARFAPNASVARHYHTGPVHFYTTKGKWWYLEYADSPQEAGSYLYEPGGSTHTLQVGEEGAEGFIVMYSANIDFDKEDKFLNVTDASFVGQLVQHLAKERGSKLPRHIAARTPDYVG